MPSHIDPSHNFANPLQLLRKWSFILLTENQRATPLGAGQASRRPAPPGGEGPCSFAPIRFLAMRHEGRLLFGRGSGFDVWGSGGGWIDLVAGAIGLVWGAGGELRSINLMRCSLRPAMRATASALRCFIEVSCGARREPLRGPRQALLFDLNGCPS